MQINTKFPDMNLHHRILQILNNGNETNSNVLNLCNSLTLNEYLQSMYINNGNFAY